MQLQCTTYHKCDVQSPSTVRRRQ